MPQLAPIRGDMVRNGALIGPITRDNVGGVTALVYCGPYYLHSLAHMLGRPMSSGAYGGFW